MAQNDLIAAWLRDARAMEKALAQYTEKAAEDFEDYPEIQESLKSFSDRSQQTQAEMDTSLDDLGGDTSESKDLIGKLIGYVTGAGSSIFKDDKIKDLLVIHGLLHFAHASYTSLAHGAKTIGNQTLADLCNRLAEEREEMAGWISEKIPEITDDALNTAQADD